MSNGPDYFLEIESHFAMRRGTPFIFSAKDWALLKSWADDGVPLALVIEAIDRCFEKRAESGRRGPISSLSYCRHAVKELWEERKDLQVGGEGSVPEADSGAIVARLGAALDAAAAQQPAAIAARVAESARQARELSGRMSVPEIEERLMAIEESLLSDVVALLDEADQRELAGRVEGLLGGVEGIDDATRKRTREANMKRLIRARLGLPRLSLFA